MRAAHALTGVATMRTETAPARECRGEIEAYARQLCCWQGLMPPELGQALRRARTCSALTQRRFRQDVRDTRAGLAVRDEIAFAQEQVVQRDRGIARDTVVGRECARRGETGAGLESPVEYRRAHLLVQRAQQEARAAFGQAQREFEFWSHSFSRLWRFVHAIA